MEDFIKSFNVPTSCRHFGDEAVAEFFPVCFEKMALTHNTELSQFIATIFQTLAQFRMRTHGNPKFSSGMSKGL